MTEERSGRDWVRVVSPWVAGGLADCYLALGGWPRPRGWQFGAELLLLVLAGRTQWRLARGWGRSPLVPPAVFVFFAGLYLLPSTPLQALLTLVGLFVALAGLVNIVGTRFHPSPWIACLVTVVVVIGARHLDAVDDAMAQQRPRAARLQAIANELSWPWRALRPVHATADGPAVVMISVDTLRADSAQSMQTVQRLQARGASWERAMSTSNWTLPALASLQTGSTPEKHGAGCFTGGHCQGMVKGVPQLAQQLQRAGYATAAVVSNPWVTTGTGFARGFDTFIEPGSSVNRLLIGGLPYGEQRQDGARIVDAAIDWLAAAPARGIYLWVHLVDPHQPYPHATDETIKWLMANRIRTALPLTTEQRASMRQAYEQQVAYADKQLLRLLDVLEDKGILDEGVVVFTSDHGEEFWDHGGFEHGHSHHGEVVDVPLLLVGPGVEPGQRRGVASLVDVAPTIRALVGLEPDGLDLRQEIPPDRIASAWGGLVMHIDCSARAMDQRAIVRDCLPDERASQLFDLSTDPRELRPLAHDGQEPVVRAARGVVAPERGETAEVNHEALRMLGYQP